jgi:L-rhamnose isomerase
MTTGSVEQAYDLAKERYAGLGVDTEAALDRLCAVPISMHCWQGDDVAGFEAGGAIADGGILATGNYPGRARTPQELRDDLARAMRLIPGRHRVNLHAIYAETGGRAVERNALEPEHFAGWIDWARTLGLGLDFNPTFFAHPRAASGYTLAAADGGVRRFWIEHGVACRRIGAALGAALGTPCVTNVWIPDGSKDLPADRKGPRARLEESLNAVFAEPHDPACLLDAVESKLFGIGSEAYVAGSHEFYLAYAVRNGTLLCLDTGHFHPTETVSDKLSAVLQFLDGILLHVSRGMHWDSDHVVILGDEPRAIAQELVRGDYLARAHIGLDYFDASINRIAAWVIGMRAMQKALLLALLDPIDRLRTLETQGDLAGRLALMEEAKTLPFGAVWDAFCLREDVPVGAAWMKDVKQYERDVLSKRS